MIHTVGGLVLGASFVTSARLLFLHAQLCFPVILPDHIQSPCVNAAGSGPGPNGSDVRARAACRTRHC